MEFMDLMLARRSIRHFTGENISDQAVMMLLEAARSAPSAGNRQPWRFYAVRDPDVRERIVSESCKQSFLRGAPVIFVICSDSSLNADRYGERGRDLYAIQDTAAAIQNLLLCAVSLGLGACWCGAFDEDALRPILNLPDHERPVAVIPVGRPVSQPEARPRRPLSEAAVLIGFDPV